MLDTAFHFDNTEAFLDNDKITARIDGQHLTWTIENVETSFHKLLVYRATLFQPSEKKISVSSQSTIKYYIGDSVIENNSVAKTTNNVATAVRGKAINYVFSGVLFDVGKATLRTAAMSAVENAARELNSDLRATTIIEGHTDSRPINTKEFPNNFSLSSARAKTVMNLLVDSFHVAPERLRYVGYGELRPIATNETNEGRQLNRRVEIRIFREDFVEQVMPEGFIDSSEVLSHTFVPTIAKAKFDSSSFGKSREQFILKLNMQRTFGAKVISTVVFDSLPQGLEVVQNSIQSLRGIDSVSTNGNSIIAHCSTKDSVATILFFAEIENSAIPETNIEHTFVVVRTFENGTTIMNTSKALLIEVRKQK